MEPVPQTQERPRYSAVVTTQAHWRASEPSAAIVGWLLALSIGTGWFSMFGLSDISSVWRAVPPPPQGAAFWQGLRELAVAAATVTAAIIYLRNSIRRYGKMRLPLAFIVSALLVTILVVYSLALVEMPLLIVAAGLRPFMYASLMVLLVNLTRKQRRAIGWIVDRSVRVNLVVQASAVVFQLRAPASRFGDTFFGPRPWGTYASPMLLGLCCAFSLLVLVAGRRRWWIWWGLLALVTVSTTGSRAAFLAIAVFAALLATRNLSGRAVFLPWLLAGAVFLLQAVSSPAISGREIDREARPEFWRAATSQLEGLIDWVLGLGLGSGTSGSIAAARRAGVNLEAIVTDSVVVSTVLSSGLVGLALLAMAAWATFKRLPTRLRFSVFGPIAIASLAFNFLELSPANVLAAVFVSTMSLNTVGSSATTERCSPTTSGAPTTRPLSRRRQSGPTPFELGQLRPR